MAAGSPPPAHCKDGRLLSPPATSPTFLQRGRLLSSPLCYGLVVFAGSLVFVQFFIQGLATSPIVCQAPPPATPQAFPSHMRREMLWEEGPRARRRLPQVIIIGARKCGTRALLEFLDLHPRVVSATEEVHFFDEEEKYGRGLAWYRRRMPRSFPGQLTVEKSPAYFVTPLVPSRIRHMSPTARLLLIVRDPVTRLLSDYAQLAHNRARRGRPLPPFSALVLTARGHVDLAYRAVRVGLYALYFPRWLEHFPRRQLHLVDGDRLVENPFSEIQKIESFLGIGHLVHRESFYFNETKGFFCVRNETTSKCLNDSKGRPHPKVEEKVLRTLRRFYEPHNQLFFKQAGVAFNWTGR